MQPIIRLKAICLAENSVSLRTVCLWLSNLNETKAVPVKQVESF